MCARSLKFRQQDTGYRRQDTGMKIGIYGGSFNPVHFGHLGLVKWVIDHTDLDQIWMLVSPNNPLKDSNILSGEAERLRGLRQALDELKDERIIASDFEFTLPRPSYSAATLKKLRETYPEHEFVLIIGEDNWDIFDQWRDWEEILAHHTLFIYPRHRLTAQRFNTSLHHLAQRLNSSLQTTVFLKEAPYFDISSTEIREKRKY